MTSLIEIHILKKPCPFKTICVLFSLLGALLILPNFNPPPSMAAYHNSGQNQAELAKSKGKSIYVNDLLDLILSTEKDVLVIEKLVKKQQDMGDKDHRWPVFTFLLGELFFKKNDYSAAHYFYESLIQWSIDDSNQPNSLYVLAMYRDLVIRTSENGGEIQSEGFYTSEKFLTIVRTQLKAESVQNIFRFNFHSALPKIEQKILLLSTRLAWHSNFEKSKLVSKSFLLDYLLLATVSELSENDREIKNELLKDISADRLNLSVAIHLKKLKSFSEAEALLADLYEKSDNTELRANAAFHLSEIIKNTHELSSDKQSSAQSKEKRIELLDFVKEYSNDTELIQKAFLLAAKNRGNFKYEEEHLTLIEKFPRGELTDRAYSNLGRHYWHTVKLMNAGLYTQEPVLESSDQKEVFFRKSFDIYEKLQKFQYNNDWRETSFFIPALMMYSQATSTIPYDKQKIQKAVALLEKGLDSKHRIFNSLEYHVLFWLGRMYEDLDSHKSREYFSALTQKVPYLYYGIRAQMHLTLGKQARYEIHGAPSDMNMWKGQYTRSKSGKNGLTANSPYYKRVNEFISSGLFKKMVGLENRLVSEVGQRISEISLVELDKNADLTQLMLLISTRLDAFKAAYKAKTVHDRIEIGRRFSEIDPFMALRIVFIRLYAAQKEENFLPTVYPKIYSEQLISASENLGNVTPELLYSVMRHESYFFPSAISINKAIGLFQFIPPTFDGLNAELNLVKARGAHYREKYLFSPENSIKLAAKWFDKLLKKNENNLFWSLANHNAGTEKVKEWKALVGAENKEEDIEYSLESIDYPQTRKFLREIIANLILTKSFNLFNPDGEK